VDFDKAKVQGTLPSDLTILKHMYRMWVLEIGVVVAHFVACVVSATHTARLFRAQDPDGRWPEGDAARQLVIVQEPATN
jgi:hypothetical protein